jgi:hypothetical protein
MDGKWMTVEFTEKEMGDFLRRVADFNKEAWKESVRCALELKQSDALREEQEFDVARLFFDKLALNTFSVVHNQSQNMRQ